MTNTKLFLAASLLTLIIAPTSSSFAWDLDLHFDSGIVGANCVGSDAFSGDASASFYSNERSSNGTQSCELNVIQGETAFGSWGGIIYHPTNLGPNDEVWLRIKTFMPNGFNYDSTSEGNRLKFLRIHTKSAAKENEGYNDWYINPQGANSPFSFIFEGEQVWANFGSDSTRPVLGIWETYEMYIYLHPTPKSEGGLALVRVWKNGILLSEITDRKTLLSMESYSDRTHIFTYWNGGAPQTQKMWIDELVLTNERPTNVDANGNFFIGVDSSDVKPKPPLLN